MNTKYNVIWVKGAAVAGETNSIVYIYDTCLPLRSERFLVIVIVPTIKCTAESEITKISETHAHNFPYMYLAYVHNICTVCNLKMLCNLCIFKLRAQMVVQTVYNQRDCTGSLQWSAHQSKLNKSGNGHIV